MSTQFTAAQPTWAEANATLLAEMKNLQAIARGTGKPINDTEAMRQALALHPTEAQIYSDGIRPSFTAAPKENVTHQIALAIKEVMAQGHAVDQNSARELVFARNPQWAVDYMNLGR